MPPPKAVPPWVAPFLAALGVCGNVTRSAELAGVDATGPYNRRARYPEFREAWDRAIVEREARAAGLGGPAGSRAALAGPALAGPDGPVDALGDALSGAGIRRVAPTRWSKGAEQRFLEELTATANVARAAKAAGFSAAAMYRRKLRDRHFSAGWEAAIEVGRSRLEAQLLAAASRTFDSDELPVAEGEPKVSVSEAISIMKHKPAGSGGGGVAPGCDEYPREAEAAKERILRKLGRLRAREGAELIAQGFQVDGEYMIPPGWVRARGAGRPAPAPDWAKPNWWEGDEAGQDGTGET